MKDWKAFVNELRGSANSVLLVQNKNTRSWVAHCIGEEDVPFFLGDIDYKDAFNLADVLIKDGVPTLLMKI